MANRAANGLAFLAWSGDRVLGSATGWRDGSLPPYAVGLVAMYVDPSARGTGCSHRLIDAVATAGGRVGARQLVLWVTEPNRVALACYRRHGFSETGRRKPLPHSPFVDEIEMVLPIGESLP